VTFFAPEEHRAGDLLLRSFLPGDGAELNRAARESYEHLRPWWAGVRPDPPVEDSEAFARRSRARWLLGDGEWNVAVLRGDWLVAFAGFALQHGRPPEHGVAETGLWVRAAEAGRGLGTRVLQGMVDWADAGWPFEKLVWPCDSRNAASVRLAERCGFVLEARLRSDQPAWGAAGGRQDTLLYGLLRGDPRPWRS
jgi:ribosomal-protein-serine acetyltransferase